MSDHKGPADSGEGKKTQDFQYPSLGIVFFCLGVVFLLTMDAPWTGLPFIALGISFFAMGIAAQKKKHAEPGE